MPINCLIKCLMNFWTVMFQKSIHGQFVNNSWTFMFQKDGPFALRLLSFPLFSSFFLSFPLFLSFFNTRPAKPANSLKTKDLRKRHFRLKFLSQGKPLKLKTLGANSFNNSLTSPPTLHSTRRPKLTLHAPPRNPTSCKALCRICRPNPTHLTPLTIKS